MKEIHSACAAILFFPVFTVADDFDRGTEAFENKDYDLAIFWFTRHIRENPRSADAYSGRGYSHFGKKEYDTAIKDFTEAIRFNPKNDDANNGRGCAYWRKKEYDTAIR